METARMLLPALLLTMLAPEVAASTGSAPITVTAHAWAPFISPMGEPFRARSQADDTLARWFNQADRNHDGFLAADEMVADAERFFATLDTDHSGEIDPDELAHYEYEIAPDIQVLSRTRNASGAAPAKAQPSGHRKRTSDGIDEAALAIGGGLQ